MLFNSREFVIFLLLVFILYWFVVNRNLKVQNAFLLVSSYVFYGWWDWRFLFLLVLLSFVNFLIGKGVENNGTNKKGKVWFILGLITNIGVLVIFKYFNFFIDSFIDLVSQFGYVLPRSTTKIILPLGISFYIFLSLSYIIDIYKKNLKANRNIIEVLLALSFFPIILAGPIQRPSSLLPQITAKREFSYEKAVDGMKQILWGMFVKVVIADNLAIFVDDFFLNYSNYSGSTLLLGAIFYSVQIYADFSGYSDMAIGTAKLFGFNLMQNFAYPYFSRDIAEFWRRWHISLVTWFRDYVFLPLSFTISWKIKRGKVLFVKTDLYIYIVASAVVWILTGLWHGANYTFILWGVVHGFFLIIYRIQRNPRKNLLKRIGFTNNHLIIRIFESILTLCIVLMAWIFFRSENLGIALSYISGILSPSLFTIPLFEGRPRALISIAFITFFVFIEWFGKENQYPIAQLGIKGGWPLRYAIYSSIILAIILFSGKGQRFIYFQF